MPSFEDVVSQTLGDKAPQSYKVDPKYAKRGVTPQMMAQLTAPEVPFRRVVRKSGPAVFKENLTDAMSMGASGWLEDKLYDILPGERPLELGPPDTTFNKVALDWTPHLLGYMIGAPGQTVRTVGNIALGKGLMSRGTKAGARRLTAAKASAEGAANQAGRKLPGALLGTQEKYVHGIGSDLVTRMARGGATAFTKRPLSKLIGLKAAAEGAGGLAYGAAEGAFKGLRGEDLAAHTVKTGLMFSAFGAAELPIAIGFHVLARKTGVSLRTMMERIGRKAQEEGRHPADVLKEEVEANVLPSELKAELTAQTGSVGRKLRGVEDPTGKVSYNVLLGESLGESITREVPKRTPKAPKASKTPIPSPTQAATTIPKTPKARGKSPAKVQQESKLPPEPLIVGLTPSETARILKAESLPPGTPLSRTHLRRNTKLLSKEGLATYKSSVEAELAALRESRKSLSSTEYNTRLHDLQRELKALKASERQPHPIRSTNEPEAPQVVGTPSPRPTTPPPSFPAGTPPSALRDVSNQRLTRGRSYSIEYRTTSGRRLETTADGMEIMIGSATGKFRGDKLLDITEIAPVPNSSITLHSGLPIDPERLRKSIKPLITPALRLAKERGWLTKEGEAFLTKHADDFSTKPNLVARLFLTPQHLFRKNKKLAEFAYDVIDREVKTATWVDEFLHRPYDPANPKALVGLDAIRSRVRREGRPDAIKELDSIILEQDALAQHLRTTGGVYAEPTVKSLVEQGYDKTAAWGYVKTRQALNTLHKQVHMYERSVRPALVKEQKRLRRLAKKQEGAEREETLASLAALTERISRAGLNYLEGYYPHMFFGGYRATVNGEVVPKVFRSEVEALRAARKVAGTSKDPEIYVFPMLNDYTTVNGPKAFTLDHPQYFMLKNHIEKASGLTAKEVDDLTKNVVRLRTRRRHFGHKVHRKGVEGFSTDVDEVLRIYVQRTQAYMQMDYLKRQGTNLVEGLTQGSPTRKAFEAYLRDVLRQKQPGEAWVDGHLIRLFRTMPFRILDDTLGLTRNLPGIGALSRAGQTTLQSQFPARRLTNGLLSATSHLKLGLGNAGSAIVNLSQVPGNVAPYLGWVDTMDGYRAFLRANKATRRMLDKAGIKLIQPKYEAGMMLDRNTFERLSLGLFNKAETLNRAVAFLGKYNQLRKTSVSHGAAFREARDFSLKTQFLYSPATNPELARNLFMRIPLQFKGFLIRELGLLHNMQFGASSTRGPVGTFITTKTPTKSGKAAARALYPTNEFGTYLIAQTLMAGILGLPAAYWLDHIVESFIGWSPLEKLRINYLKHGTQVTTFDDEGKPILNPDLNAGGAGIVASTKGTPALIGTDFSQRVGLGDFIPVNNADTLMGPVATTFKEAFETYQNRGNIAPAIASTGTTTRGLYQAAEAWNTGTIRNLKTNEIIAEDVSRPELVARVFNIPTTTVTRQQDRRVVASGKADRETRQYAPLLNKWAIAKQDGDDKRAAKLLKQILEVARREGIDGDRIRQGLRSAIENVKLSPREKLQKQSSRSVRRALGAEGLR